MRARWAALVVALAAAGLIASIPVFTDSSDAETHPAVARSWVDGLSFRLTTLATASNGERLFARRERGTRDGVCLHVGTYGGEACGPVLGGIWDASLTSRHIALVARTRDRRGIGWWGLLGDRVRTIRVHYGDGTTKRFEVRHGFVVFGDLASVMAQDAAGTDLGRIDGGDPATINCTPNCNSVQVFTKG